MYRTILFLVLSHYAETSFTLSIPEVFRRPHLLPQQGVASETLQVFRLSLYSRWMRHLHNGKENNMQEVWYSIFCWQHVIWLLVDVQRLLRESLAWQTNLVVIVDGHTYILPSVSNVNRKEILKSYCLPCNLHLLDYQEVTGKDR